MSDTSTRWECPRCELQVIVVNRPEMKAVVCPKGPMCGTFMYPWCDQCDAYHATGSHRSVAQVAYELPSMIVEADDHA